MECDTPGWVQHLQRILPHEAAADVHTNVPDTIGNGWPTIGEEIQLEVQGITEVDWVHHVVMWNFAKTGLEARGLLHGGTQEEHSFYDYYSYSVDQDI